MQFKTGDKVLWQGVESVVTDADYGSYRESAYIDIKVGTAKTTNTVYRDELTLIEPPKPKYFEGVAEAGSRVTYDDHSTQILNHSCTYSGSSMSPIKVEEPTGYKQIFPPIEDEVSHDPKFVLEKWQVCEFASGSTLTVDGLAGELVSDHDFIKVSKNGKVIWTRE